MARDINIPTFHVASGCAPFEERPMLPENIDPQLHLSRNDRPQPFWLICEQDTMIATLSGHGRVAFKDASVRWHTYETGDFVYVPGGVPSRILPDEQSVQYRFKAVKPGLEAIAWYCESCDALLLQEGWDANEEVSQAAYLRISSDFNRDEGLRTCSECGTVHPEIDLSAFGWRKEPSETD